MSDISGGVATAAGMGFQHVVAVEALLDAMESAHPDFVFTTEDPVGDVVDFSLTDDGDRYLLVAQAKAAVDGTEGTTLSGGDAAAIFAQLIKLDSERYVIYTNRRLSASAKQLMASIRVMPHTGGLSRQQFAEFVASVTRSPSARKTLAALDARQLSRLPRVEVREYGDVDFRNTLRERLVDHRRRTNGAIGGLGSQVLVGYVVAEVLFRSASRSDRRLSRSQATALLTPAGSALARATGVYEFGRPFGPIPGHELVGRDDELTVLASLLAGPPIARAPRRQVLTGLSGIGKSTIARAFAAIQEERYDVIVWFDADSTASLRHTAETVLSGFDLEKLDDGAVSDAFRAAISESAAAWLIVFDNSASASVVQPWMPTVGHVDVLATSTDATAWIQWPQMIVGELSMADGIELVRTRIGVENDSPFDVKSATALVDYLGRWPLAIELACAFLRSSGRGLNLTHEYLERLRAIVIDNENLVPAEYYSHPTLLQAVLVALEELDARSRPNDHLSGSKMLDALAYFPARSTPSLLVAATAFTCSLATESIQPEDSASLDDSLVDEAFFELAGASLVTRVSTGTATYTDHVSANEILLSVVRNRQPPKQPRLILDSAQSVLGQLVLNALDHRALNHVQLFLPSAESILGFTEREGEFSRYGLTLLGNMAMYYEMVGSSSRAHALYSREYSVLRASGVDAPLILAKIACGVATSALSLNRPRVEITAALEEVLTSAERWVHIFDADPPDLREVLSRAAGVIGVLQRGADSVEREKIALFRERLSALASLAGAETDPYRQLEIAELLRDPSGDEQALAVIEEQLSRDERDVPPEARCTLLALRAEPLMNLGRYEEAFSSLDAASQIARRLGMGDGSLVGEILNAWLPAAVRGLDGKGDSDSAVKFCRRLSFRFATLDPEEDTDAAKLAICRAATLVISGPFERANEAVDATHIFEVTKTHEVSDVRIQHAAVAACKNLLALRSSYGGARVVMVSAWRYQKRCEPDGSHEERVVLGVSTNLETMQILASSTGAKWVETSIGIGVVVDATEPIVLWAHFLEDGWFSGMGQENRSAEVDALRRWVVGPQGAARGLTIGVSSVTRPGTDEDEEIIWLPLG